MDNALPVLMGGDTESSLHGHARIFEVNIASKADEYFNLKTDEYSSLDFDPFRGSYSSDSVVDLWRYILSARDRIGGRVGLRNVRLVEWLPLSPGRFLTPEARRAREVAQSFYDRSTGEYAPNGKSSMLLGGIGTLRVSAQPFVRSDFILLNAVSSNYAHTGIPVRLPADVFFEFDEELRCEGEITVDLSGRLKRIAAHNTPFVHDIGVPSLILDVDAIHRRTPGGSAPIMATVAIAFGSERGVISFYRNTSTDERPKRYSYASFPIRGGAEAIERACEWLNDYIDRHAEGEECVIATDFDDSQQWFERQVQLPLSGLGAGLFGSRALRNASFEDPRIIRHVFFSYRSSDDRGRIMADIGRVYDYLRLQSDYKACFWDVRSLRAGDDWERSLEEAVKCAHAVVAFIGPDWETAPRRKADDIDWVHKELRWAVRYNRPIIPVMIAGRRLSDVTLPADIDRIKKIQAIMLDHANFASSMRQLVHALRQPRAARAPKAE